MRCLITIIFTVLVPLGISSCLNVEYSNIESASYELNLILRDNFEQESSTFLQAEPIKFELTVSNTTPNPITLRFNSSQQYDFTVRPSAGTIIWTWSDNMSFTQSVSEISIPAQDAVVFSETWDQTSTAGANLAVGTYTATGLLPGRSERAQIEFRVE